MRPFLRRQNKGVLSAMIRRISLALLILLFLLSFCSQPASAQLLSGILGGGTSSSTSASASAGGVVVRTTLGLPGLQLVCLLNGCTVVRNLDGTQNQVYLVRPNNGLLPNLLAGVLRLVTGILNTEVDQVVAIPAAPSDQAQAAAPPGGLWDTTPVSYYGTTVPDGYVNQPAAQIIHVSQAHGAFKVSGKGIIADIDTGVDPSHPALRAVLLAGYDFTRNQVGGSEMSDIGYTSSSSCTSSNPCRVAYVNQH